MSQRALKTDIPAIMEPLSERLKPATGEGSEVRIWLIKDGEQLPVLPGSRKHRMSNLAGVLAKRGHEVVWWCSTHSHQDKTFLFTEDRTVDLDQGFQLRLLHSGGYPRNLSWQRLVHHNRFAWKLNREMRRSPTPDAIVCCLPIVETVLACLIYTRQHGIPLVIDIRDPWPDIWLDRLPRLLHPPAMLMLSPYYAITRFAFARAEVLTSISNRWLRWAQEAGRRSKGDLDAVVVHGVHSLEPVELSQAPRIKSTLEGLSGKLLLAFSGSFNNHYDLETVCEAAILLEGESDLHFLLAGDGPSYPRLVEQYGNLSNLTFLGWLERLELDALLQNSDVALIPYKGDMLGSKVYEYMAAGLPVLVSAFGDVNELIGRTRTGLAYQVGNPRDFADKTLELTRDAELREAFSERALDTFLNEFSADRVYGVFADIIETVANRHGQGDARKESL